MIYMNDIMKERTKSKDGEIHHMDLVKKILSETVFFHDCIIYDHDKYTRKMLKEGADYEKIINAHGGEKTVYEVGCNDIDIDFKDLAASEIETFLLDLNDALVKKFNHKMAIYIYPRVFIEDDFTETEMPIWNLRFHSLWDGEPLWVIPDPDDCKDSIVFLIADEKWLTVDTYPVMKDTSGQD